jgi:hypothetical protein
MFVVAQDFDRLPYNLILDSLSDGVFDDFVNYHEEEQLRKLLGNLFYDSMVTGVKALPNVYQAGTFVINDLVVFVSNNKADIYKSLVNSNTSLPTDATKWEKQPLNRWARLVYGDAYDYYNHPQKWYGLNRLVKPLIYSLFTRYNYDTQIGSGVVVSLKENSSVISPNQRIIRGWNEYSELAGNHCKVENTLFGFLYYSLYFDSDVSVKYTNMTTYLSYEFCNEGKINSMGL